MTKDSLMTASSQTNFAALCTTLAFQLSLVIRKPIEYSHDVKLTAEERRAQTGDNRSASHRAGVEGSDF